MKRACLGTLCAGMGVLLLAAGLHGAVITPVEVGNLNPQQDDFEQYFNAKGWALAAHYLTWDTSGGNLAPPGYAPSSTYQGGAANPAWLDFTTTGGGGGGVGGGGGGGGAGGNLDTFELAINQDPLNPQPWSMDFSVLIFDPTFAGTKINVYLIGEETTEADNTKSATVEAADVLIGKLLTWHIDGKLIGGEAEKVKVLIEAEGAESHAAAFFMSDAVPGSTVPEPATMAMLALGVGGVLAARRRRR